MFTSSPSLYHYGNTVFYGLLNCKFSDEVMSALRTATNEVGEENVFKVGIFKTDNAISNTYVECDTEPSVNSTSRVCAYSLDTFTRFILRVMSVSEPFAALYAVINSSVKAMPAQINSA